MMKKAQTRLTEEQILHINKSGETPYSFLKKAVEEKIAGDKLDKKLSEVIYAVVERFAKQDDKLSALAGAIGTYKEVNAEVLAKNTEYLKKLFEQVAELKK